MGSDNDGNMDQGERTTSEPSAEEILATGSSSTDLESALAEPARRGRRLSSTMLLVVGVLAAAVFVGGLFVGRATAPDTGRQPSRVAAPCRAAVPCLLAAPGPAEEAPASATEASRLGR